MSVSAPGSHLLAELEEDGVRGTISIAPSVLVEIVESIATEVAGVTGIVKPKRGVGRRTHPIIEGSGANAGGGWHSQRGIRVRIADGTVEASLSVSVRAGTQLPRVAQEMHERIAAAVERMLGMKTGPIDVHVVEIIPEVESA